MFKMSLFERGFDIEKFLSLSREEIFLVLFLFFVVFCYCVPKLGRRRASYKWEINMSAGQKKAASEHPSFYW